MFEKPQYLTPDGFRRSMKNPVNKKKSLPKPASGKALVPKNTLSVINRKKNMQKGISPEAAKLIAEAIKGFLHE